MKIPEERFERDVAGWLESEGGMRAPSWLHEIAMARAIHAPQRPGWLVRLRALLGQADGPVERASATRLRPVLVAALALLTLIALWLAVAGSRPAPDPPQNGRILVARQTTSPPAEYLTLDADGTNEVRLFTAQECGQCAWFSPDGRRIMFPESANGRLLTAIVSADGAAKVVLQPLPESTLNLGPGGWSADGSLIALAGWDDADASLRGIYVATPEGSDLRQISQSPDGRPQDWTTFSPDGRRLLYMAIDPVGPRGGGIAGDLFVANLDGTGQLQVNPTGTKVVATARAGRPMDWSPTGETIVFAAVEGELDAGRSAIYVANADGTAARRVSDSFTWAVSVDWEPDGPWVLSGDPAEGTGSIWMLDVTSGERRTLWTSTEIDGACCGTWSPDGQLILFQRGATGERDLWSMRRDGTAVARVTDKPADYIWYEWGRATE
jgi:Tol biopolymer transport system component